jgi:hypothetical protein
MKDNQFEALKRIDNNGSEYWSSRELAQVLEYPDYRKFLNVIDKAKTACENSGEAIHNHFVHKDEMVQIGSGAKRPIDTIYLSRYAVNVTGHGWRKLMRATQSFTYVIETLPTQLPIFDFLQKHGPVDDAEAYGNLNMGAGFALYVAETQAAQVIDVAKKLGLRAFVAGHIEDGDKKVVIKPKGLVYAADTLAVR